MSRDDESLDSSELPVMSTSTTSVQQDIEQNSHGIANAREMMFRALELCIRRELPQNIEPTKKKVKSVCSNEIEKFINDLAINDDSDILHWIASMALALDDASHGGRSAMILVELIAEMVIAAHPEVLKSTDGTNELTLIQALLDIKKTPVSAGKVILTMCRAVVNSSDQGMARIGEVISNANKVGQNCLHMAAQSRSNSAIFQLLVGLAPPKAVDACSGGQTPLHVLLEHGLCSFSTPNTGDGQSEAESPRQYFKNIAVLIAKNSTVLEALNKGKESPYMVFKRKKSALGNVTHGYELSWWRRTEELLTESVFGLRGFENALKCLWQPPRSV